jgi:glycerol-3-phosphate dehydrogenase
VQIAAVDHDLQVGEPLHLNPSAIINATGAWVDHTLRALPVKSRQLIGGTKGSHFVTSHAGLRQALAGRGIYAEAADGRPVFLLPLGENSLVGTTDIPFPSDPGAAVASEEELAYLLDAANLVFPELRLSRDEIDWHYSGVRPLPYVDETTPGAVTRRHWLEENTACPVPLYSVIGGKLTTCRSLAEETADVVLRRLGLPRKTSSRERPIPGGEKHPANDESLQAEHRSLATQFRVAIETIEAVWRLYGTRTATILRACGDLRGMLADTALPVGLVRWVIEHEWVQELDDLICRRLMLLYEARLSTSTLEHLDAWLAGERLSPHLPRLAEVEMARARLFARYGRRIGETSAQLGARELARRSGG